MGKPIRRLEDLDVWQLAITFAVLIHDLTARLPLDERFGLIAQMRKASVSIASNIAEGYGRQSTGDYLYHLRIAVGENREVFTQLIITCRKRYIAADDPQMVEAFDTTDRISQMLYALIRSLGG